MKRLPWICALALFGASAAHAQQGGGRYRYDNFDTQQGVQVESLPTTGVVPAKKVRLTAGGRTHGAAAAQPKASLYTRPSNVLMAVSRTLDGFTTGNAQIDNFIVDSGARHGVDPVLLYAIMHRESAFRPRAVSRKGARGLMQLMPGTAARFGVANIFDPRQNIEGGARYMRFLLDYFGGDVSLALAGYNAGEGAVLKYGRRVPPYSETQEYVRRITERYEMMRDPETARRARMLTPSQLNAMRSDPPPPVYEREVFAVRLPDGKLLLVNQ